MGSVPTGLDEETEKLLAEPFTREELDVLHSCVAHCSTGTHANIVKDRRMGTRLSHKCFIKFLLFDETPGATNAKSPA